MPPLVFQTRMRYDVAGRKAGASFEERVGAWNFEWERDSSGKLWIRKWQGISQTRSRAERPIFRDVTAASLGKNRSYQEQLLRGADHWRTVLDGASGIDVYGNNGIAVGDFDNDGFDDLYVCQPAGLPNRLYRNRGMEHLKMSPKWPGLRSSILLPARSSPTWTMMVTRICWSSVPKDLCSSSIRRM